MKPAKKTTVRIDSDINANILEMAFFKWMRQNIKKEITETYDAIGIAHYYQNQHRQGLVKDGPKDIAWLNKKVTKAAKWLRANGYMTDQQFMELEKSNEK